MKIGATSLIMRKITMRCHLIQVRMAIIKNCTSKKKTVQAVNAGEHLEKRWEKKLIEPPWRTLGRFL